MEQQIQDLVASIRKEGIEEAKVKASEIILKAQADAKSLIEDAKKQSAKMIADAESECSLRDQSAKAALQQAARDVSLTLKKSIEEQVNRILASDVEKEMDTNLLAKIILSSVDAGLKEQDFVLSEEKATSVAQALKGELKAALLDGVQLKASREVASGLRIQSRDGSGYVDLSAEEVTNMLSPYLSPALQAVIFG